MKTCLPVAGMRSMKILITGAAGNLGSFLTHHLLKTSHHLNLLIHRRKLPTALSVHSNVTIFKADLEKPETLTDPCSGVDCIVHFAGKLFAPEPEKFLHTTNVQYAANMATVALTEGVKKFILISFPHVEGESTPEKPAQYSLEGNPDSLHAKTRLEAEKYMFQTCKGTQMTPVAFRAGMIYGKGVLMIEAARWLSKRRLLAVWREPTWEHLLALPDFLHALTATIEKENASGIYNVADDHPVTLQEFLDTAAAHWGYPKPRRLPKWMIYAAAAGCETVAHYCKTPSPLTRDFIKIGMASSVCDTTRMKKELLPVLKNPTLKEGLMLL